MNIDDAERELREMAGVNDVHDGSPSAGRVKAIDFRIFPLNRPTDTSNFVFGRFGGTFHGALLRLPRVPKDSYSKQDVRDAIKGAVAGPFIGHMKIRLVPEVSLDSDYHYPHVEVDSSVKDAVTITEHLSLNYTPLQ